MSEATKPEQERRKFRAVKGVRDILPPATDLWNWFEKTARSVMETYNFHEIRLPIFEETELFARSIGTETEVVGKEMYSFSDQASETLRMDFSRVLRAFHEAQGPGPLNNRVLTLATLTNDLAEVLDLEELPKTSANVAALQKLKELQRSAADLTRTQALIDLDEPHEWAKILRETATLWPTLDLVPSTSLRPEATASVARAYIEHGMHTLPGDVKLYYIGPMFRRERPQKGRYRQFYQIGAEVLGTSDAPAIDAELIEMLTVLLDRCQIEKWTLLVNSIGCANCRPKYVELLRAELRKPEIYSQLREDSKRRIETNPLRVMDSKLPEEQGVIEKLPKISEHLCPECREHYESLKKELRLRNVDFTPSPRLVRGLDYYMRTTFEITSPVLGAQNALCGGGRYDGLVELLGGPRGIKGIGFALGEDRFIDAIEETKKIHATRPVDVFVAWMGEKAYPTAVRLARVLRSEKHSVELPPEEIKFRKALERADKLGARYALILGDEEIHTGELTIKRLADGVQEKISEDALVDYFRPKPA